MAGFFAASLDPTQPDDYESRAYKRKLLDALMMKGTDTTPVQSWTQGLARMLDAAGNAYEDKQLKAQEKATSAKYEELMNALMGSGSAPAPGGAAPSLGPIASDGQPAPTPPADIPAVASTSPDKSGFVAQMAPHALKVAQETGLDPRLVIAQAALETGYGKSAPGNNFFGIKSHGAPGGNTLSTTEVVNGQPVRTSDSFRAYADMGDSAAGYANFLKSNPRYAPLLAAQGLDAQIAALGKSGYATDPDYAAKIAAIAKGINLPPNALAAISQAAPVQVASNAPGLGYAPSSGGASLSGQMPPPADELTVRALQDYARRKNLQPPSPEMGPASPLQNVPMLPGSAPIVPPGLSAANGPAGGAGLVNPDAPAPGVMQAGPAPLRDTGDGSLNNPFLEGSPEAKAAGANLPAAGAVPAGPAAFPGAPASGMDRAKMALAIAMNPSFSPQQRQMAMSMATMLQNQDKVSTVDLGNSIGIMDQRGNIVRTIPKQKEATFGVIGKDADGREQYGFIDPAHRSITPAPGQQSTTPQTYRTVDGRDVPLPTEKKARDAFLTKMGTDSAASVANAPTAASTAEQSISTIDKLIGSEDGRIKEHSGLGNMFGYTGNYLPTRPGSNTADAEALLGQIKDRSFLAAFDQMRGAGAITEAEGSKATGAIARLSTKQSPEAFKEALGELRSILKKGRERALTMANGGVSPAASTTPAADPLGIR